MTTPLPVLPRRHPARGRFIGSADAPAILGVSKWSAAIDAWHRILGMELSRPGTALTRAGEDLEEYVLRRYAKAIGHDVRIFRSRRSRRHVAVGIPFLGAHLDGWDEADDSVVEAKTSPFGTDYGEPADGLDGLPMYVRVQIAHQAMVTGRPVRVAALLRGYDFRVFGPFGPDELGVDDLRDELVEWYATYIVPMVPPPADDTEAYGSFLTRAYPADDGGTLEANELLYPVLRELFEAREAKAEAERREQGARNAIEAAMGTAQRLLAPGVRISWKAHGVTRTAWKDLAGAQRKALDAILPELDAAARARLPETVRVAIGDLDTLESIHRNTKSERPFVPTFDEEDVRRVLPAAPLVAIAGGSDANGHETEAE